MVKDLCLPAIKCCPSSKLLSTILSVILGETLCPLQAASLSAVRVLDEDGKGEEEGTCCWSHVHPTPRSSPSSWHLQVGSGHWRFQLPASFHSPRTWLTEPASPPTSSSKGFCFKLPGYQQQSVSALLRGLSPLWIPTQASLFW